MLALVLQGRAGHALNGIAPPTHPRRLAQHVTHVHMHLVHPQYENVADVIDLNVMRHYIAIARTHNPTVPGEVGDYIVNAYVHLRSKADETADFQYTCARTLLSVVRLSSALVRGVALASHAHAHAHTPCAPNLAANSLMLVIPCLHAPFPSSLRLAFALLTWWTLGMWTRPCASLT